MINVLLIIICIIALVRMHPVALTFALACSVHKVFCENLDATMYYLSAGVFDVLVIGVIATFITPSPVARSLIFICMASLLFNFYGWLIWFFYFPPTTYNMGFIVLYCLAILFLLRKDSTKNERRFDVRNGYGVFPLANCKSIVFCKTLHGEREERGH